jgi:hypothetical protein
MKTMTALSLTLLLAAPVLALGESVTVTSCAA